jgi:hypothetical protein
MIESGIRPILITLEEKVRKRNGARMVYLQIYNSTKRIIIPLY